MPQTVIYAGPHAAVHVVALGVDVARGDELEVSDDALAAQLLAQDFVAAGQDNRVDAVKARVGEDPEQARIALAVEQESARPRPSLVRHLEDVIAAHEEAAPPAPPITDQDAAGDLTDPDPEV
jgi:hypothetical protein